MPCVAKGMPGLLRCALPVASQWNPNQKCLSNGLQRLWENLSLIRREESLSLGRAVYEGRAWESYTVLSDDTSVLLTFRA